MNHPFLIPYLNGQIECAVTGIKSNDELNEILLSYDPSVAIPPPSPVDDLFIHSLSNLMACKNEMEYFNQNVQEFCRMALYNLEKSTETLVQGKIHDLKELPKVQASTTYHSTVSHSPISQMVECPPMSSNLAKVKKDITTTVEPPKHEMGKKNPKSLPKQSTEILKNWILSNYENPYPNEATKKQLIEETGLTRSQVINWFINARRRLIKPLLTESDPSGKKVPKRKQLSHSPESDPDYVDSPYKRKKLEEKGEEA